MPYRLTYQMLIGPGESTCDTAQGTMDRYADLVAAGASGIVITRDGKSASVASVMADLAPNRSLGKVVPLPIRRPRRL